MRNFVLITMALVGICVAGAPAWADSAPPEGPCTAAYRSSSSRQCVECDTYPCEASVPQDYRYECTADPPDTFEVWCEPYPDEGGCVSARSTGVSGTTGQVLLGVLLLLVGLVFYRRSRSEE